MLRRNLTMWLNSYILCLFAAGSGIAATIGNGGFETGDLTGWTASGDVCCTQVTSSFRGFTPHSGSYFAYIGPFGVGFLGQSVVTSPGNSYTIDFFLGNLGRPNLFDTIVDGTTLSSMVDVADQDWTRVTVSFVGSGTMSDIKFRFQNPTNTFVIDDVTIVDNGPVAPEPSTVILALGGAGLLFVFRRRIFQ